MTILLIVVASYHSVILSAQDIISSPRTRALNNLNIGLLGEASVLSLSYERLFILTPGLLLSAEVGVGFNKEFELCIFGPCEAPQSYAVFPHHLTLNIGRRKNHLELGVGGGRVSSIASKGYVVFPIIGYRHQPTEFNKAVFRIHISPPVTVSGDLNMLNSPIGFNVGITF